MLGWSGTLSVLSALRVIFSPLAGILMCWYMRTPTGWLGRNRKRPIIAEKRMHCHDGDRRRAGAGGPGAAPAVVLAASEPALRYAMIAHRVRGAAARLAA